MNSKQTSDLGFARFSLEFLKTKGLEFLTDDNEDKELSKGDHQSCSFLAAMMENIRLRKNGVAYEQRSIVTQILLHLLPDNDVGRDELGVLVDAVSVLVRLMESEFSGGSKQ